MKKPSRDRKGVVSSSSRGDEVAALPMLRPVNGAFKLSSVRHAPKERLMFRNRPGIPANDGHNAYPNRESYPFQTRHRVNAHPNRPIAAKRITPNPRANHSAPVIGLPLSVQ